MGSLPPSQVNDPLTVRQLVADIAYNFSDALFHYPLIHRDELSNIYTNKHNNLASNTPIVKTVETRSGAGLVLYGTLENELSTSALLTASTLVEFLPNIITLFHSIRTPLVFHVSSDVLVNGQIKSDFIKALAAKNSNFSHLISSTPQETYDFAIISHLVANITKKPIIHIYDGVNIANVVDTNLFQLNSQELILLQNQVTKLVSNNNDVQLDQAFSSVFGAFSKLTQREYTPLKYFGAESPKSVVILTGASDATIDFAIPSENSDLGFVSVKQFSPFPVDLLQAAIPNTANLSKVFVIDQRNSNSNQIGTITSQLLSSLSLSNNFGLIPLIQTIWTQNAYTLDWNQLVNLINVLATGDFDLRQTLDLTDKSVDLSRINGTKKIQIFNTHETYSPFAEQFIALAKQTGLNVYHQISHDPTKSIYVSLSDIQVTKKNATYINQRPILTILEDAELLSTLNLTQNGQLPNQILVLTELKGEEFKEKVPYYILDALAANSTSIYTFDLEAVLNEGHNYGLASYLAITKLTSYEQLKAIFNNKNIDVDQITSILDQVVQFENKEPLAVDEEASQVPTFFGYPNYSEKIIEQSTRAFKPDHQIIQKFVFSEAFNTKIAHRPDLHDAHLIKVSKFERLTPLEYDRNVFHVEFDTSDASLTYEIGDALGVYGHNDSKLVEEFLTGYGIATDSLVKLPSENGHEDLRTAFQVFAQYLDVFGRPTKKFYQGLAQFASDEQQAKTLEQLASPQGAVDFKRRVEDTVTYADILEEFTSARPSVDDLVKLIPTIKPRHYSISSSQKMHPNSVHLLVVAVEWQNSKGARFGQCTRYLANLQLGESVTVSIKPSVMKLPPRHEQPVIMAGLGTGMAPFRAFVEERHYFKSQGIEVGPMALYFGSRSRHSEYLYGQELDAYHMDQLITRLGLAFSRDQPQKIYIQHRMQEDSAMLQDWMLDKEAHFYLCGPTWPESDVRDAMVKAFSLNNRMTQKEATNLITEMKEDERYILELY